MRKLSLIDEIFYKTEQYGMSPTYGTGIYVIDPATAQAQLTPADIANHVLARVEKIPMMRQKLVQDAVKIGHMRLVDDPDFNAKHHVVFTTVDQPGDYEQLTDCLEIFTSQRLDVSLPLWRLIVIEGLRGGRYGVVVQMHHSLIDGSGAMQVLGSLWDKEPVPAETPNAEDFLCDPAPTPLELLRDALIENAARLYIHTPKYLVKSGVPVAKSALKVLANKVMPVQDRRNSDGSGSRLPRVRKTSLNVHQVSATRSIAYTDLPLQEAKAVIKSFGGKINDLVMLMNSYALQHYFNRIGETIDFDLVAVMPISQRTSEGSGNDQLSVARLSLHNTIDGIEERLAAIIADTASIKRAGEPEQSAGLPNKAATWDVKELIELFSPVILDAAFYGVVKTRVLDKLTFCNVAITNVPGTAKDPLYLAGAKQESLIPLVPPADTIGLTISITSTPQLLLVTYNGCGEAVKDKALFVEGARHCYEQLKALSIKRESPETNKPARTNVAASGREGGQQPVRASKTVRNGKTRPVARPKTHTNGN